MNIWQTAIISFVDLFGIAIFSKKLLGKNIKWNYLIGVTIVFAILSAVLSTYVPGNIGQALQTVLGVSLVATLTKPRLRELPFLYIISFVILMIVQLSLMLPLQLIFGVIEFNLKTAATAQSMAFVIYLAIYRWVPIDHMYRFASERNRTFLIIMFNLFAIAMLVAFYWANDFQGFVENIIVVAMFSFLMIIVNFIILKNGLKNEVAVSQLKTHEQYLPIVNELIDEIRARQHDFKNHLQAMRMIAVTAGDTEEMKQSMDQYMGAMVLEDQLNNLIVFNNKMIGGFLYSKFNQASLNGVKISFDLYDGKFDSRLHDYEWVEILGVLIDNAMETDIEDNHVKVTLKKEEDMNRLVVANKHPYLEQKSIKSMFLKGSSSKADSGRGYGLYNVNRMVQKHHGQISVQNMEQDNENYVVFQVLLP